jgi:hypothetical protein
MTPATPPTPDIEAPGRPGQLGGFARSLADGGVNIEFVYSDHDHQLIVGVDDLAAARRVVAALAPRGG